MVQKSSELPGMCKSRTVSSWRNYQPLTGLADFFQKSVSSFFFSYSSHFVASSPFYLRFSERMVPRSFPAVIRFQFSWWFSPPSNGWVWKNFPHFPSQGSLGQRHLPCERSSWTCNSMAPRSGRRKEPRNKHTVDGNQKSGGHQLRLVV